jgi:hypothetical protein
MYDSIPKEREGEQIEEVLPAAIYTTSSTGNSTHESRVPARSPRMLLELLAPERPGQRQLDARGKTILTLAALCAVLLIMLCVSLVL